MENKLRRCAIYIRVSTAEQYMHGKSLQAQREYLEHYAKEHNMIITGVYADEGLTARKELKKRKAIHSLLETVKHREIDVIIFWKMDRWFRNVSDFYKVQDILDEYDVTWIATAEPNINMHTREGRLNLNLVLSIGQNEVDTTSERIKFVNEASIRQGKLIFGDANMPLGYKSDTVDGVKRMVKDEEAAPMVEEFFRYFKKHQNKSATVRHMQETFGIHFTYTRLRTMLSSEFYIGKYRGVPYCPAYVTEEEWEEIQQISGKNIKSKPSDRIYLFSGLMHCPICGNKLSGTGCSSVINRKTGEKRAYCYYKCNQAFKDGLCANRYRISQNLIEQHLLKHLEEDFKHYTLGLENIRTAKTHKQKAKDPERIKKELERLNRMFQKERINWEYYNTEYERLETELKGLTIIQSVKSRNFDYIEDLLKTDFRNIYEKLSPENKQAFWRGILDKMILKEDYSLRYVDFL